MAWFTRCSGGVLGVLAVLAASSCAPDSRSELGFDPASPLASPTMRTYDTALLMHIDSGGDVWVVTPMREGVAGSRGAGAPVQAFLAFSADQKVTWRLGIPIAQFDAIEDLRSSGLPTVTASAGSLVDAIAKSGRSADVVVLTGLEGPGLVGLRSGVVAGLPPGWQVAKDGRSAWRPALNLSEPQ